jgi:hypothetical protein
MKPIGPMLGDDVGDRDELLIVSAAAAKAGQHQRGISKPTDE